MTSNFSYDFTGGTAGAAMTTANSGFTGAVVGTWTFENTILLPGWSGTMGGKLVSNGVAAYAKTPLFTATATEFLSLYVYVEALPSAYTSVAQILNGSSLLSEVRVNNTGNVQLRNSASTAIVSSPAGIVEAGKYHRVELTYNNTTGQAQVKVWKGTDTQVHATGSPAYDSGLVTTTAAGTATAFQIGSVSTATGNTFDFFAVRGDNASMPPPVVAVASNSAPTVNAGSDQTSEPWSTVTLTATASDPDGTTPTISWAQTAGTPTVTLAGSGAVRTFTAPLTIAGTTLTFTATASDGTLTGTDSMTVTVLPASERVMIGGSWAPAVMRAVGA